MRFAKRCPGLTDADVGWRYLAMTGVLMMHVVDVNRRLRSGRNSLGG